LPDFIGILAHETNRSSENSNSIHGHRTIAATGYPGETSTGGVLFPSCREREEVRKAGLPTAHKKAPPTAGLNNEGKNPLKQAGAKDAGNRSEISKLLRSWLVADVVLIGARVGYLGTLAGRPSLRFFSQRAVAASGG
jgi:hypothetical protein